MPKETFDLIRWTLKFVDVSDLVGWGRWGISKQDMIFCLFFSHVNCKQCVSGEKRHDSEFYKHSIDYISKFHASNLEKKAKQRPVLSRFEPTFHGSKVFYFTSRP